MKCVRYQTHPKGGSRTEFVVFVNNIQVQSNKVCYIIYLCENFQRRSCSRTISLYTQWCIDDLDVGGKRNPST